MSQEFNFRRLTVSTVKDSGLFLGLFFAFVRKISRKIAT